MAFPLDLQDKDAFRVSVHQPGAEHALAARLAALCQHISGTRPAILCIGTDRSTGDALGPLVGTLLQEYQVGVEVWGTLQHPVHAANLTRVAENLRELGLRPVVAVDACLGTTEQVGSIVLGRGCIRPGAGVNKVLPEVGDIHMTGTVNVAGHMEYVVLQNTRLWLVFKMALVIAGALTLIFPRAGHHATSPPAALLQGSAPVPCPQPR
ncbi:MAG: spore protease YyaC [Bacillota bacterium]|nr:spore protease YyaC [Bacillota bacterium]